MDCRLFDEQVVRHDPEIADLMGRFVCVRLVQANALDMTLFQFDYDLTFTALFLNADKSLYGRFGSRSQRDDATKDISMVGFRKAMMGALELHSNYPANKSRLQAKLDRASSFESPDDFPSLRGKYHPKLDYAGKVVQSCLHCHQLREAERLYYWSDRKPIPDEVLFPWPIPDVVGLSFDPREKATVQRVSPGSAAARSGFQPGDELVSLEGQPLISIADVQWVLHRASAPATLTAEVRRRDGIVPLQLQLDQNWRRQTDISWRATTWDLRRIALGGLVLKSAANPPNPGALALTVDYVGQYGEHAAGKKAGFQKDDLITEVDGLGRPMTESELIGYLVQSKRRGDRVLFSVLRKGAALKLELVMQ